MNKLLNIADKVIFRLFAVALMLFATACVAGEKQDKNAEVVGATELTSVSVETLTKPSEPLINKEIKPQYVDLGVFVVTAYCPCYECSEGWGNATSTGVKAQANRTVAVDPKVIAYGSVLVLNGKEYTAEDCGGNIKGKKLDVYFETHEETRFFGVQKLNVLLKVRQNEG